MWEVISLTGLCQYTFIITFIQGVPLATEPSISLIILPLMRILQQNLKRTSLCKKCDDIITCWKWPPFASRQDWTRRTILWKVLASTSAVTAWISLVVCFQDVCGSWFVLVNKTKQKPSGKWQSSREARQAGNRLASWRTAASCRNNYVHYRHIPLHFSHDELTSVQISLWYLHWC